jgi:hypothetical protein
MRAPTRQSPCHVGPLSMIAEVTWAPDAVASPGGVGYHENGGASSHPARYFITEENGHGHRRATGDQGG